MQRDFTYVDDIVEGVDPRAGPVAEPNPAYDSDARPTRHQQRALPRLQHRQPQPGAAAGLHRLHRRRPGHARHARTCCRCRTATCRPPTPTWMRCATGSASRLYAPGPRRQLPSDLDYDTRDLDADAFPGDPATEHGTAVSGVIAAALNNGTGGAGVAPEAGLVGYRIGFGANGTLEQILSAFELLMASMWPTTVGASTATSATTSSIRTSPRSAMRWQMALAEGPRRARDDRRHGGRECADFGSGRELPRLPEPPRHHRRRRDRQRRQRHLLFDAGRGAARRGARSRHHDHRPGWQRRLRQRRLRDGEWDLVRGAGGQRHRRAHARRQSRPRLARRAGDPGGDRGAHRAARRVGRSTRPTTGTAARCTSATTTASAWSMPLRRCASPRAGAASSTSGNEWVGRGRAVPRSPIAIPDGGSVSSTITLAPGLRIDRVEVDLALAHPYLTQLRVTLTAPDGTESVLVHNPLQRRREHLLHLLDDPRLGRVLGRRLDADRHRYAGGGDRRGVRLGHPRLRRSRRRRHLPLHRRVRGAGHCRRVATRAVRRRRDGHDQHRGDCRRHAARPAARLSFADRRAGGDDKPPARSSRTPTAATATTR
jgi:hypothetical protein